MNANFADGSNGTGLSIGYRTDETTAVLAARTATGNIAFYSYDGGWSESMRIKNDGNVGIGTNSPSYKLEVNGGTTLVGGAFYVSTDQSISTNFTYTFRDAVGINNPNSISATPNAGYTMCVGRSNNGAGVSGSLSAVGTIKATAFTVNIDTTAGIGGSNGDVNAAEIGPGYLNLSRDDTAAAQQIRFEKNGALHSYIETTTSGLNIGGTNVGIGETAPESKLEISDTSVGTDPTALDSNFLMLTNKDLGTGAEVWGMGFNARSGVTNYLGAFVQAYGYFQTAGNTGLIFGTRNTSGVVAERMRIDDDGNVGIGTDSPGQKLDVNGQMTHNGLVMKSGDGVYIDRYLAYTINISLIAFNWVDTGIYSNSGSYQLGASGTYAVQIYSDSHAGEPYWYNAYWSGIMSWYQGSVNQNAVFEIPLTQAAHSTNNRPLELRIQNTLGSGPGTPTNNARLEVKTTAAGTNSVSLFFRFRRLI